MKLIEMIIDESEEVVGTYALSQVDKPAIKSQFILLNESQEIVKLSEVAKEKQILLGAALIPNLPILREDPDTGEQYYIYFSNDTVEKTAHLFLKNGFQGNTTLMHNGSQVEGATVVESWIKTSESDKSTEYGLNVPIGTWIVMQKIDNVELWEETLKSGELKGFSIEGIYKPKTAEDHLLEELEKALATK